MEYSAQRVRSKTRAAVKRREDAIEQDELESGELNLIPYLDIVTNLMLFLLASVSAGLILVQIDTTLPDPAPPSVKPTTPAQDPKDQPLKLVLSVSTNQMILWSGTGVEGTLREPRPGYVFKRVGFDGEPCDGAYMCQSNACDASKPQRVGNADLGTCVPSRDDPAPVFEYRRFNDTLFKIASEHYAGKPRKRDTYPILVQADFSIPYATITSIMAAMRCKLPEPGQEPVACALPTDDPELARAPDPVAPKGCGPAPAQPPPAGYPGPCKLYDTNRAVYDPKVMALFHDIQFSTGFE
jgi:biopolymer transport protein ExbD